MQNFDLKTEQGLQDAIQYVNDQTQPETIPNTLIADIFVALKGRDINLYNLDNVKKRLIKNAVENVIKGGFYINDIPDCYGSETFSFMVKSSNLPDEEFVITKGASGGYNRYALGEPNYSVITKEETKDDGLLEGEYYYLSAFPNSSILFGRNLGNLPAGTNLGTIPFTDSNPQSMYIGKSNFGQDIFKYNANVTFTNNSTQNIEFDVEQEAQYNPRIILIEGQTTQRPFYSMWEYMYFYLTPKQTFTLQGGLRVETFLNGVSLGYNQWNAGTQFWKDSNYWIPQPNGLTDNCNIEIVVSDI